LGQTLAGVEPAAATTRSMIPTVGKMIIGFILPFALGFVAIPLESFVASSRTMLGIVAAGVLRIIAFVLRLIGNICYYIGRLVINLYDLIIFPSVWLEGVIVGSKTKRTAGLEEQLFEDGAVAEKPRGSLNDAIEYKESQD
jgi:hypothetical protein